MTAVFTILQYIKDGTLNINMKVHFKGEKSQAQKSSLKRLNTYEIYFRVFYVIMLEKTQSGDSLAAKN